MSLDSNRGEWGRGIGHEYNSGTSAYRKGGKPKKGQRRQSPSAAAATSFLDTDLLKLPHSSRARMEGGEACSLFVPLPWTFRCRCVAFQPPRCRCPQLSHLPCCAPLERILSPLTDTSSEYKGPCKEYSYFDKLVDFLDDHNDRKLAFDMEQRKFVTYACFKIYAMSVTIRIVISFDFMFIALIWKIDFVHFMVLIIAILNDGTIKDRVKPSPQPDSWKLREIFATGIVLGSYLALMTIDKFGVRSLRHSPAEMMAAFYLQVNIISQALIFVTRSCNWSYVERPGLLLLGSFMIAQLELCKNQGNGMGLDWCNLALHFSDLCVS
ncbi:hypothetical protein Ahy_B09g098346 [Arachis hypogaea]|uniref:Cation-transporting P-type ATPase N-terminal domain-containing protein n=1 Tax=Arachis hypogaea TaxID=3818 RepID=A0A444XR12_ARAHY|nr:hypothetical protein Ahy_B09g098346 [Arachis hypogaea]